MVATENPDRHLILGGLLIVDVGLGGTWTTRRRLVSFKTIGAP